MMKTTYRTTYGITKIELSEEEKAMCVSALKS